jgi:hypothetical protein
MPNTCRRCGGMPRRQRPPQRRVPGRPGGSVLGGVCVHVRGRVLTPLLAKRIRINDTCDAGHTRPLARSLASAGKGSGDHYGTLHGVGSQGDTAVGYVVSPCRRRASILTGSARLAA